MLNPRTSIVQWLTAAGVSITKQSQNVFNNLPVATYYISSLETSQTLDREIGTERVNVQIDVWSESGIEASSMLDTIEQVMRQHDYILTFASDVPNTDSHVQHISARFEAHF